MQNHTGFKKEAFFISLNFDDCKYDLIDLKFGSFVSTLFQTDIEILSSINNLQRLVNINIQYYGLLKFLYENSYFNKSKRHFTSCAVGMLENKKPKINIYMK